MRKGKFPTHEEDLAELLEVVLKLAMEENIQGPRRAVVDLMDQARWAIGHIKVLRKALEDRVDTEDDSELSCST